VIHTSRRARFAGIGLIALLGLTACADDSGDASACERFDEIQSDMAPIVAKFEDSTRLDDLSAAEAALARQWEFRLAEASVQADDHELSVALRELADDAGNVTKGVAFSAALTEYAEQADVVIAFCD